MALQLDYIKINHKGFREDYSDFLKLVENKAGKASKNIWLVVKDELTAVTLLTEAFEKEMNLRAFYELQTWFDHLVRLVRSYRKQLKISSSSLWAINKINKNFEDYCCWFIHHLEENGKSWHDIPHDLSLIGELTSVVWWFMLRLVRLVSMDRTYYNLFSNLLDDELVKNYKLYLKLYVIWYDKEATHEEVIPLIKKAVKDWLSSYVKKYLLKKEFITDSDHQHLMWKYPKAKKQFLNLNHHIDGFADFIMDVVSEAKLTKRSKNLGDTMISYWKVFVDLFAADWSNIEHLFSEYLRLQLQKKYEENQAVRLQRSELENMNLIDSTISPSSPYVSWEVLQSSLKNSWEDIPYDVVEWISSLSKYIPIKHRAHAIKYLKKMFVWKKTVHVQWMNVFFDLKWDQSQLNVFRNRLVSFWFSVDKIVDNSNQLKSVWVLKKKIVSTTRNNWKELFSVLFDHNHLSLKAIEEHYSRLWYTIDNLKLFQKYLIEIERSWKVSTISAAEKLYSWALPENRRLLREMRKWVYVMKIWPYRLVRDNNIILDLLPHDLYEQKYYKSHVRNKWRFLPS